MSDILVDLDGDPFVPDGWSVEEHKEGGQFAFNPANLNLSMKPEYIMRVEGNKSCLEMKDQRYFNANLLDWFIRKENQHLIPESWHKCVFWGTRYNHPVGGPCVRFSFWLGSEWGWGYYMLGDDCNPVGPSMAYVS